MKILFVGNANSFLLKNLATQLQKYDNDLKIDILSDQPLIEEDDSYNNVFAAGNGSKLARMKYVKVLYFAREYNSLLRTIDKDYDAIHIFYVSSIYRLIWNRLRSKAGKVIVTVFGSDFYKANKVIRKMISKIVYDADLVTGSNIGTLNVFSDCFEIDERKKRICRFGLSVLDELDIVNDEDCLKFKEKYGIADGATVIACGYNASQNQQIEIILDQLSSEKKYLQDVFLTFQFHGLKTPYVNELRNLIEKSTFPYVIIDDRLTDKELAFYRKLVNIFIQIQKTDQFSGAMQEHIYSGSTVITGKWLPYEVLDEKNTDYVRIDTTQELGKTVLQFKNYRPDVEKNKKIITSFSKWDQTIKDWRKLYE